MIFKHAHSNYLVKHSKVKWPSLVSNVGRFVLTYVAVAEVALQSTIQITSSN